MPIIIKSGEFKPYLYHVDIRQYGFQRVASSFCYWDGDTCLLIDVGTSDDVNNLLSFIRKNKIPYSKVKGLILTHYHFDHGGGSQKLWKRMVKKNPNFKIMVPQDTHDRLQNADSHLIGAKTTFGDFVGTMKPMPEMAYSIVKKDTDLPIELKPEYTIQLISTPGHSHDHCAPTVFKNGKAVFVFGGEATGTLFHGSKLVSLPTSMPPNFNYEQYMSSFNKIYNLKPESLGLCHFGLVKGQSDVNTFLMEHKQFISDFRNRIIELFTEKPSTRHVIENMEEMFTARVDPVFKQNKMMVDFFSNLQLALTYGMMVDLGYRKPKYEEKQ